MKNYAIIIIIVALLATTGIYVASIVKKNKAKDDVYPDIDPLPKPTVTIESDGRILSVQTKINELLPSNYTKLVVDGVWGSKSEQAIVFLNDYEKLPFFKKATLATINTILDSIL